MELLSRLELPNLLITNEVLYLLSYSSIPILIMVLYFAAHVNHIAAVYTEFTDCEPCISATNN